MTDTTEETTTEEPTTPPEWMFQQPLSTEQLRALTSPLSAARVSTRAGSGGSGQLSYLEAWDVKASLARIFGIAGFSAEVTETHVDTTSVPPVQTGERNGKPTFQYTALAWVTVRLTIHQTGAVYTESAAASQVNPQIGEAVDFAIKTAESDALKRAATYLGTQFGLSLYNSGSKANVIDVILAPGQAEAFAPIKEQRAARAAGSTGQALVDRAMGQQRSGNRENNRARAQMRDEPAPPPYVAGGDNENGVTS